MPPPRIEKIITALDVGSWKACALIAGQTADGALHVLGTGQRESRGVQRGYVADMEQTEHVVREAIEQAERIAGLNIDDVWVAFSAGCLLSDVAPIESELGGHRIEQEDIDDLLAAGRAGIDPEGRMILHAQPALYTLDGLTGVKNPIGLHADRLGVDIHVIMADGAPVRNLEAAVRQAHLDVNAVVAAPVAAGLSCLSDEERDLGVALVELGASVTTVSLYAGGMLVEMASLPFGASDITDDIASAFGIRRSQAQRLQHVHGSALASPRDNVEVIDLEPGAPTGGDAPRITRAQLVSVIRQRLDAMMGEIGRTLKDLHFVGPVGRQVVLVGGGADLRGIADYTQSALGRAVRVGWPKGLSGLPGAHAGPAFATLAGLILYAASDPVDLRDLPMMAQDVYRPRGTGIINRLMAALKSSF
ncbi:MAG TPA: cell division protein FtsA [Sphingopyxis sp.]|nr:cell division protein FtsA [Sphingopyxis sp.]HMP44934.1 cell division protein FtsA [Sphingopyxis sp.]HMQ20340.1 cell division protein FtsA [Sphingopyxis sp.]